MEEGGREITERSLGRENRFVLGGFLQCIRGEREREGEREGGEVERERVGKREKERGRERERGREGGKEII